MSTPELSETELCDWLSQESAIISSNFDHSKCVEFARKLSAAVEAGRIEIRPVDRGPAPGEPFTGIPMTAKFPGACAVCGRRIDVEDAIVYRRDIRKAAHLGCGQPERR